MKAPVSRALMVIALRCLGGSRREWALAMRAEFDVALADGKSFAFAAGCLVAAWREMPNHAEGRLVLSTYALALGVLIPMAALQFALAFGFSLAFAGREAFNGLLLFGWSQNPLLGPSQIDAAPSLLAVCLLIGVAHLRLAWVLVELDWARVAKVGALIGAALMTLFIFMAALFVGLTLVVLQTAAVVIEFTALIAVARRHARLFPGTVREIAGA
jgi:hypothetical protein